ncbi:MAG TPA: glycosyltransferase family 4 protein [Anaerolineae bacterium]|nr:glycosyltransferase family 4 protein [Anaerolineae bacterium]
MKVALLAFDFAEDCIRLASGLAREADVCLLLPRQLAAAHSRKLHPAVSFQPFTKPRLRQPLQQARMIHTILRRIRDFCPDVVHIQGGHFWFNLALPLLRQYPLVFTIQDARHHVGDRESRRTPQIIFDFGYRRADRIIVHGRQLKQMVVDRLGIPSEIIHAMPMIALGDDTAQSHIQEDEHLVLFFGRIWEYKGLEYLIRAEPLITAQVPQARIVIAGRGEDLARYRNMMVHPERFTVYNEYIPGDKRAELFRRASVVVLPYIEASTSGVIPVAYTFAKPVVATTVGSLPEMVEDGRTGFLVPPRDPQGLADAIVRLLRDRELRHELGAKGRQKIDTEWSPESVARQTLAVYERALSDAAASTRRDRS